MSYKYSLVGDIPGAYEQAFKFDTIRYDDDEDSNVEVEPLIEGMAEVKLSKEKSRIREFWSKALIVKVFGRTVGFSYLTFKINAL